MSKLNLDYSVKISPSILSADLMNLSSEIQSVERGGADFHHIDVMDGHFVPNLTFGIPLIQSLRKITTIPLDVHIMIDNPDEMAMKYIDAGADMLTFQVEAARHPHRIIQSIKTSKRKAGIALNPGSALELCFPVLPFVDSVMLMSVNPGFGGQSFIDETIKRVEHLKQVINGLGKECQIDIEVDGGVSPVNSAKLIKAGASILVAGTAIYGEKDRARAIASLRQ